jgi:hypothetical protein
MSDMMISFLIVIDVGGIRKLVTSLPQYMYISYIPLKYGMEINVVKFHFPNMFVTLETVLIFSHVCNSTKGCGDESW